MVAKKQGPMGVWRRSGRLLHKVNDRIRILRTEPKKQARHEGIIKTHVAFFSFAEVSRGVSRPEIGFGDENFVFVVLVDVGPQFLEKDMGLGKVFATGSFLFKQESEV